MAINLKKKSKINETVETTTAAENAATTETAPETTAPEIETAETAPAAADDDNAETGETAAQRKAARAAKIDAMPDEMHAFTTIPENLSELSIDEKRAALIDVIEKNNPIAALWRALINNMQKHAPNSYTRSFEYKKIYAPNLAAISKEITTARETLKFTYSELSSADMETLQNYMINVLDSSAETETRHVYNRTCKFLSKYVLVSNCGELLEIINAGITKIVIVGDISADIRKMLKQNNYKYVDDYETTARTLPGVGEIAAIDGMLYELIL